MKIIDIRATPVTVPLEAPLRHANGCHWGRFVRTIVEVETDEGIIGLGEMGGGGESAVATFQGGKFTPVTADVACDQLHDNQGALIRIVDLDGDGKNEAVMIGQGDNGDRARSTCAVWVGKVPAGGGAPSFTLAAQIPSCVAADAFFADVVTSSGPTTGASGGPATDGLLDLILANTTTGQLAILPQTAGGLFDVTHVSSAQAPFTPSLRWIDTADLNGDSIPDLVFNTERGIAVAFAQVTRP